MHNPKLPNIQMVLLPTVSLYLAEIYACDVNYIKKKLPTTMNRWGKVCNTNAGDKVCAQCAISQAQEQTLHDASLNSKE